MDTEQLNPGDRGDLVTVITNTLHRLGYLDAPTNIYDGAVENAVQAFQQERGLTAIDMETLYEAKAHYSR